MTAPAVFEWVERHLCEVEVGDMVRVVPWMSEGYSRGRIERIVSPGPCSTMGRLVVAGSDVRVSWRLGTVERWERVENPPVLWCFYHWRQAVAEMTDDPFECGTFLVDCDIDQIEILRATHRERS